MSRKALHPTFRRKEVVQLHCRACERCICRRGMKATLLADTHVELYSTDLPPFEAIDLVNSAYSTQKCRCRIKDIACLGCGSIVGYTVIMPCRLCLESCNNGHLWMYHSHAVEATDRVDKTGSCILQWGDLAETDETEDAPSPLEEEMMECLR